jgi:adenylate cyclase
MNTMAPGVCPASHPIVPLWNGFGRFEQVPACLKRFAIAQDAWRHGCRPNADLGAERGDWHDELPAELPRRCMAILVGDVAGYSRLIEIDDVGTVTRLRLVRHALLDPTAALFHAALIRHTADAILLAFDNTVDAIGCAITLQSVLYLLHEDAPEGQGIRLRIGLSVGEVLLVDNDIHGMGVNIAARLEALAGAGEIYLCERAVNDVRHVLPLVFEPIGARRLHNISTPVRTFRIAVETIADIACQRMLPVVNELPV